MIYGPRIIFIQWYYHLQNCSKEDDSVLCCWRDCAFTQLQGLYSAEWDMNSGYVRSEKEACFSTFTQTNNVPKNVQTYASNHDSLYTVLWYPVSKLLATLRPVYFPELDVITLRQTQCTKRPVLMHSSRQTTYQKMYKLTQVTMTVYTQYYGT